MWVAVGRIVLDYYNNDKVRLKQEQNKRLFKTLQKKYNLSVVEVADFEDPERSVFGFAAILSESWPKPRAEAFLQEIEKSIDELAEGRVQVEDTELFCYGET